MPRKAFRRKLTEEGIVTVANRFKVLSEPMRLKLLIALEDGEQNVTSLVGRTESTQANVSKHLSILADAGMISRRREGLNAYYFISDQQILKLCDLMCHRLEQEFAARKPHFQ